MVRRFPAILLLVAVATGCQTTAGGGVRFLTASNAQEQVRLRGEIADCRLIEREEERTQDDTKFRKRAVQYGADTLVVIRLTNFASGSSYTTSVEGGNPTSRPEFETRILAEYYQCGAKAFSKK